MKISMIMIIDPNKLIGASGGMPWHIPSELQYFKSVTMGKPLIMGRKTYESIGRPLPGRTNIVVTSQTDYAADGVVVVNSLDAALTEAKSHLNADNEVMIIGGAALCCDAMPLTQRLYLTELEQTFEGDTWLDSYEPAQWQEISREDRVADGYALAIRVLERV